MKERKKSRKRKKRNQDISKYEWRALMGEFDQTLERHHGAFRRKGR
ncbi:hypothetical protein [Sporolactobacillus sp. KGMB 08714]